MPRSLPNFGIVRLNSLVGLLPPGALYLRYNFLVCLIITKLRDTKTAEIPRCYPSRSVQSDNAFKTVTIAKTMG